MFKVQCTKSKVEECNLPEQPENGDEDGQANDPQDKIARLTPLVPLLGRKFDWRRDRKGWRKRLPQAWQDGRNAGAGRRWQGRLGRELSRGQHKLMAIRAGDAAASERGCYLKQTAAFRARERYQLDRRRFDVSGDHRGRDRRWRWTGTEALQRRDRNEAVAGGTGNLPCSIQRIERNQTAAPRASKREDRNRQGVISSQLPIIALSRSERRH
jgi:hypothetical protein